MSNRDPTQKNCPIWRDLNQNSTRVAVNDKSLLRKFDKHELSASLCKKIRVQPVGLITTVKLRHFNRYVGFFTKCGEILSINEISTYLTRSQPNTTRSIKFPLKIIAPPWLTISQPNPMDLTARIIKLLWWSKTHIPMVGEEWHDSRPELIFRDFLTMLPLKYSLEHLL